MGQTHKGLPATGGEGCSEVSGFITPQLPRNCLLVRQDQFAPLVERLSVSGIYFFDTETTGLEPYNSEDRIFSIIMGDANEVFYFNFQKYPDLAPGFTLSREHIFEFRSIFANTDSLFVAHNAKFDMAFLAKEGLEIGGRVYCTQALGRVLENDKLSYSLKNLSEWVGEKKDDAVENYIKEKKLYTWHTTPGKKKRLKRMHFEQVPASIIIPYGCQDVITTRELFYYEKQKIDEVSKSTPDNRPRLSQTALNEIKLTQTCFAMEQVGIKIDRAYCERAAAYETDKYNRAAYEFEAYTDLPFCDSNKRLAEAFTKFGEDYPRTEKGNPSFTDEHLASIKSPIGGFVRNYRDAYKKANTYYRSFLHFADDGDNIHAEIKQAGTQTGRFSYTNPNLQNLNKEEDTEKEYLIRRAFIPRDSFCFVMMDYDQMEYRMMLDYAGELDVISSILTDGLDVHEATAKAMGIEERNIAKTINFMLLYGGGAQKLADQLKVTLNYAKDLKWKYFNNLPHVSRLIRGVTKMAERRGYIFNWAGRRYLFKDSNYCYKAPNYLIQGGCADVVKTAMNQIASYLFSCQSRMLVQVHDEILFEAHETEYYVLPRLKEIMEGVYPYKHLPLTCSVEHSFISWADKAKDYPAHGEETRNNFQGKSLA